MYILNCNNGEQIAQLQFNVTGPYIPALKDSILLIGTNEGLYAANLNAILSGQGSKIYVDSDKAEAEFKPNSGIRKVNLYIQNEGNVCDSVDISIGNFGGSYEEQFKLQAAKKIVGVIKNPTVISVYTNDLVEGDYYFTVYYNPHKKPDTTIAIDVKVTIVAPATETQHYKNEFIIKVFPNPANISITFVFKEINQDQIKFNIYDLTGRQIHSKTLNANNNYFEYNWNLEDNRGKRVPKGEYICTFFHNTEIINKKIIIH